MTQIPRSPKRVTDPNAVIRAMKACDRVGRKAFRERHGFGKSVDYFVRYLGRTYDSKPLIAVAYDYQHHVGPLVSTDFSGGADTVEPAFTRMGFPIVYEDLPNDPPEYRSEELRVGEIYTRNELITQFDIQDATINNGIFKAKGSRSIWLFVTRDKTADRPQLVDRLEGDTLHWSGQPAGRTDKLVIDHLDAGNEILLFFRERRDSYPGGGFRYEGPFIYQSHSGAKPTAFILTRDILSVGTSTPSDDEDGDDEVFHPKNATEARAKVLAEIYRRRGQGKFRRSLVNAYEGRCAITGCAIQALLEAAHIVPYRGDKTNHITNGLLLRADIHTLFDLGLIGIRPDYSLDVCPTLARSEYAQLVEFIPPRKRANRPSPHALEWHLTNIASPAARKRRVAKAELFIHAVVKRRA